MKSQERLKAAQLARDLYSNKIDFKTFALNYPDNIDDNEVKELLNLIEHEPKKGGMFGVNESKHELYLAEINRIIDKLEFEGNYTTYQFWFEHCSIRFERKLADEIGFDGVIKIINLRANDSDVNISIKDFYFGEFYFTTGNGIFLRQFPKISSWPNTRLVYLNFDNNQLVSILNSKSSYIEWKMKEVDYLKYEIDTQVEKQIITVP